MQVTEKARFIACQGGRPVFPGFVNYIHATKPWLIHRYGWVDASDTYDDFGDSFSEDNGRSWSEPIPRLQSYEVPGGRMRYAENACFFDAPRGRLLTFCSRGFYPQDRHDADTRWSVVWDVYDVACKSWRGEQEIAHDLPGGLQMSFCFPILSRQGRLLVPAMTILCDEAGRPRHYPGCWAPLEASLTLIGEFAANGDVHWTIGEPVAVDPEQSSRGFSENALAELSDGRIGMIMRGDNSAYPERPGYKWIAFSNDEGRSWSRPEPLRCSDGSEIESGSNGCALVRSIVNGRLYFIGNLALAGERAQGNWPRSPLVIAELQEEPFALKRETITEIDRRQPNEPPLTQLSNFRYYQDRETGEIVLFLSRFGERDPNNFKDADYYRYRVVVD